MTPVPLICGVSEFGEPNTNARMNSLSDCQKIVDIFISHGHKEFDTSSFYGHGTSEKYVGQLDLKGGFIDTKAFPTSPGDHAPDKLRVIVEKSVASLGPHKINILYLHFPDRIVPYEDTLREINELYKQGLFKEFGLSNYKSWEVAEIYYIAKDHGWVLPTVYQGVYNAVQRTIETELIPCLRKFGIRFYAYSPLAGGLMGGRILSTDMDKASGSRWDPKASSFASTLHQWYMPLVPIFRDLRDATEKHGIKLSEAGLRWVQHHGVLTANDGVLLGPTSAAQLEETLRYCDNGPLPDEIVKLIDEAYHKAKADCPNYA